jgi:hypothetical protein
MELPDCIACPIERSMKMLIWFSWFSAGKNTDSGRDPVAGRDGQLFFVCNPLERGDTA